MNCITTNTKPNLLSTLFVWGFQILQLPNIVTPLKHTAVKPEGKLKELLKKVRPSTPWTWFHRHCGHFQFQPLWAHVGCHYSPSWSLQKNTPDALKNGALEDLFKYIFLKGFLCLFLRHPIKKSPSDLLRSSGKFYTCNLHKCIYKHIWSRQFRELQALHITVRFIFGDASRPLQDDREEALKWYNDSVSPQVSSLAPSPIATHWL